MTTRFLTVSVHPMMSVSAYLLIAACAPANPTSPHAGGAQPVRTADVVVAPVSERLPYLGTVHARDEVQVLAETPGSVTTRSAVEGEFIRAGTALLHLATPEQHARLQRVEAERARAAVEQAHACDRAATDERLGQTGDLPGAQVDIGRKACDAATSAVAAAEAARDEVAALTSKGIVRAPFDGTVLQWLVDPGQAVMPGRPLARFGTSDMEVRVRISEVDHRRIRTGMPALVDVADLTLRQEVGRIAPAASGPSRSVEVRVPLTPEDAGTVLPGMSATVGFVLAEAETASTVPLHAVHEGQVFVLKGDRVEPVEVVLGPREGGRVAVMPALPAGTQVVTRGVETLDVSRPVWAVREVMP